MGQASDLWAVRIKDGTDRERIAPFGNLWILATDAETATRKTKRWMKQNDYVGWRIISVEAHGEIDVF